MYNKLLVATSITTLLVYDFIMIFFFSLLKLTACL